MSTTTPVTRWSLLQAVAWVFARDRKLVEEIGRDAAAGSPWTSMSLVVRTGLVENDNRTLQRDGWQPLAERIVAHEDDSRFSVIEGTVRADGCPALHGARPSHRQPLTIEARDLRLDGDRDAPWRGCFLAGSNTAQRNWYDVEVIAADVERAFPVAAPTVSSATGREAVGAPKTDKQRAVLEAISVIWPAGRWPRGLSADRRNEKIKAHLLTLGVVVSVPTIRRALSNFERD